MHVRNQTAPSRFPLLSPTVTNMKVFPFKEATGISEDNLTSGFSFSKANQNWGGGVMCIGGRKKISKITKTMSGRGE